MQRTINKLSGHTMESTNGDIGKAEEFYFEDTTWPIPYLILKRGNWFHNRKVLISPQAIEKRNADPGNAMGIFQDYCEHFNRRNKRLYFI